MQVLNFMWLKFFLIWRYFRFWSLVLQYFVFSTTLKYNIILPPSQDIGCNCFSCESQDTRRLLILHTVFDDGGCRTSGPFSTRQLSSQGERMHARGLGHLVNDNVYLEVELNGQHLFRARTEEAHVVIKVLLGLSVFLVAPTILRRREYVLFVSDNYLCNV